MCLSDGFPVAALGYEQRAVIDGDAKSAAIAAASVIAKVTRDRYMHRADAAHPGWEFAQHVGYATPEHREAIERLGVSPLHRLSFQSMAYQQLALSWRSGSARDAARRQNAPSRCSRRRAGRRASIVTPIASKRSTSARGRSAPLDQPARRPSGGPARCLRRLSASHGLPRRRPRSRLDLAEHERPAVERDEVELAPARAVVARDDLEAAALEVLGGELLAERAEAVARVVGHGR